MAKTNQSRLNSTYIICVLSKYSDVNHPMSYSEIVEKVNLEYGGSIIRNNRDEDAKNVLSRDTVQRTIDELIDVTYHEDFSENSLYMKAFGFRILEADRESAKENAARRFYYENRFEDFEIATIIDAVQNHSFFHEDDLQELLSKICNIKPSYPKKRRDILATELSSCYRVESDLYNQVRDIYDIIEKKKPASLKYGYYNASKKLEETYPDKENVVFPIRILWSNGYYYMVAWSYWNEHIVNYRIDRIMSIKVCEDARYQPVEEERIRDVLEYRAQHPVMYAGEEKTIVLLCKLSKKNHLMNAVLDSFGRNVRVIPAKEDLVKAYIGEEYVKVPGEEWCTVTFKAVPGGVELWATQYCENAVILEPKESAAEVKRRLQQGLSYYK